MNRSVVACFVVLCLIASPAFAQGVPIVPHDITVRSMFEQADWLVKTVMVLLVLASITTLSIWFAKTWEILVGRRKLAATLALLGEAKNLSSVLDLPDPAAAAMAKVAMKELEHYPLGQRSDHADGVKERVVALIQRIEAGQLRRLSRGVSVLGSIGAAAPFIGLFGTVWGIMNSFIGIAQAQTTNLAVVAPGIAEALLATAFGLVAAIPAVLIYNATTRAIAGYRLKLSDAATHVLCLLSRDLEACSASTVPKLQGHKVEIQHVVGVVHGI